MRYIMLLNFTHKHDLKSVRERLCDEDDWKLKIVR